VKVNENQFHTLSFKTNYYQALIAMFFNLFLVTELKMPSKKFAEPKMASKTFAEPNFL